MDTFFKTSFDEGFYDYQGIRELTCPNGWTPRWVQGTKPGKNHRPEYDSKDHKRGQPEVLTGRYAANFFTVHATHDACLYAKFRVGAGKGVRAGVWSMNVTRDRDGSDGGHGMQIGIDPTGGTDHTSPTVVYGDWWSSYMDEWKSREWHQVTVDAISETDEITVFLRSKCDFPVDINASHWDDFVLEIGQPDEVKPPEKKKDKPIGDLTLEQLEQIVKRIVGEELANL
jgi:hypothetical protein